MCFVCKYLQLPLSHINVSLQTLCHQGPIKGANAWGHELLGQGPSSAWNPGFRREGNFPKDSKEQFWQIRLNPVCLKCALEDPINCFWPLTDNQQKCVSATLDLILWWQFCVSLFLWEQCKNTGIIGLLFRLHLVRHICSAPSIVQLDLHVLPSN